MTGEMHKSEVTPDAYPIHFAIAKKFNGTVEPFDQYQGPYVVIGTDIRLEVDPYASAPLGFGVTRLWIVDQGIRPAIYNETNEKIADFFYDDPLSAIEAARSTL